MVRASLTNLLNIKDKTSYTILMTDDSIKEIDDIMSDKSYYISADNRLPFSPDTGTFEQVVASLSNGLIYE